MPSNCCERVIVLSGFTGDGMDISYYTFLAAKAKREDVERGLNV